LLATIVLLRPFLELSVSEIYWNLRSDNNSSSHFYKWLLGDNNCKQGFSQMIDYYYLNCDALAFLDKDGLNENKKCIKEIYRRLCSYNHTPILNESIISHAGNTGVKSHEFFANLIELINEVLFHINLIYLCKYPMVLFPQDIYRHFGYNGGPMGLFFDEFDYAILKGYFGADKVLLLRKSLENYSVKDDLISFIHGYKMLNEDEMEQSWREFVSNDLKNGDYYKIEDHAIRVTLCKTKFRGLRISTSYIQNVDLKKFNRDFD